MSSMPGKRAFVLPFIGFLMFVAIHSLWKLLSTGFAPVWLGPLIVAGAFFGFMAWLTRSGAARTSAHLAPMLGVGAAGVMVSAIGAILGSTPWKLPLAYAAAGLVGEWLYVFWFSHLGRTPSAKLEVGRELPELALEDEHGRPVSTRELRGRPAILLFYRGNWCPLCVAQVREIAEQYREIESRGATVALVSPQSHEQTRELASRFDVPLRFLVDRGARAARALGIVHEKGVPLGLRGYDPDTVMPTVVVTDAGGRILFADQTDNYRVRPEPSTFLAVLDRSGATAPRTGSTS